MRNIIFRGKRINRNGEWGYGDLRRFGGNTWVFPHDKDAAYDADMVDPATVGQYTGLNDKNGKKIFEGDILKVFYYGKSKIFGVVKFGETRFFIDDNFMGGDIKSKTPMSDMFSKYDFEVVDNIYDNPELLYECQR
jgi:uncharacterized phage protein (TIGR01671 family)